jgi:2-dehydro-3-deoxyphosphogluconate aldolase/(4S)-4-hydroxy-2-oxoglutarate aldolase
MPAETNAARRVLDTKVVAIVRSKDPGRLAEAVSVLAEEGISVVEVSFNTPNALSLIAELAKRVGDTITLGAGTVLDSETAVAAIHAGAQLIVAPTVNRSVIEACSRQGVTSVPGGFTTTEIVQAYEYGADFVKLFPAGTVGPAYLKALNAVIPQVPIIPVGGVDAKNAKDFLGAGAVALGVGSSLINTKILSESRFDELRENARAMRAAVEG